MGTIFKTDVDLKESDVSASDQDLLLAAEIGQALLEKNKELELALKSTQEYAEEQAEQAKFYCNQVVLLREEKELCNQSYDQLEAANQQLTDKCEQYKIECKLLIGKNARLWEHIHSLEKKHEELSVELNNLSIEIHINDINIGEVNKEINNTAEPLTAKINDILQQDDEKLSSLEKQVDQLRMYISELKVQLNIAKLQKEEVELHMEDILHENDILQKKISSLNQEVREWEMFAQREENYRRLAKAFSSKHSIEFDDCTGVCKKTGCVMVKAKSCESLNNINKQCTNVLRAPNLITNVLSSENSSSFLSELDTDYADLIKRYEELLEKFQNKEKLNENPEKVRKVQRAIQTLSFDFTSKISPLSPIKKNSLFTTPNQTPNPNIDLFVNNEEINHPETLKASADNNFKSIHLDYKRMFSDIFNKIKESKEFHL